MPSVTVDTEPINELLAKWCLFCDPHFLAASSSLSHDEEEEEQEASALSISWKRPHELVDKPKMFVDGVSRGDVTQGGLGDCWFLAACSALASRPELLHQVIPDGQVLYGDGYKGIVMFRLWRMGEWLTVYIDDRLPVTNDDDLLYGKCKDSDEFWLPLLEKAFAKFHGGYQNIVGGFLAEGLISLTGSISFTVGLEGNGGDDDEEDGHVDKAGIFKMLQECFRDGALITCSRGDLEKKGLVTNHAYTVTDVKRLRSPSEGLVRLVRVRNPWGVVEWSGAWGDSDARWYQLDDTIRKQFQFVRANDGEFWMKMAHFVKLFDGLSVACKAEDVMDGSQIHQVISHRGAWRKGNNAGGSVADAAKFATNPQFLLIVLEPDDADVPDAGEAPDEEGGCVKGRCSVLVELVQENDRSKYSDYDDIGITVFKAPKPSKRLTTPLVRSAVPLPASTPHLPQTSVVAQLTVVPGSYVVVPSTRQPDCVRNFLIRAFCRKSIKFEQLRT